MKYSVSLYSFMSLMASGKKTDLDCIETAAALGFDAVEAVDFVNLPEGCRIEEKTAQLKSKALECGLEISSLAVGADFLNCKDVSEEIARVEKYIDAAEALGAKFLRHDVTHGYDRASGKYKSYDALLPKLADACRQTAEYAASKGVAVLTENHGFFSQDSERLEKLVNAVNHANFGLLCDIGNFACADENPALAVARIAPYTRYVHAKDFIIKSFDSADPGEGSFRSRAGNFLRGTIIGHGNVPVMQCLHILKATGFDGFVAVEFEGLEPPETAVRIGFDNLKKYCETI